MSLKPTNVAQHAGATRPRIEPSHGRRPQPDAQNAKREADPVSFSSSRRIALDPNRPSGERMSHARSCAMLVGQKWGVGRSVVLDRVREVCGVDLLMQASEDDLRTALTVLSDIKSRGLRLDE